MGKKAKKRVANGFTWDDYGNRYVRHLYNLEKLNKETEIA